MAKKALIFSFVYYPRFIGGAEVAVKEITDRIPTQEIEFHLVALRLDDSLLKEERVGNVMVHRIGWTGKKHISADSLPFYLHLNKYLYPLLALWKAAKLHKKHRFDLIWAIMANYSGFGALFFKLFHTDVPFLLTLQEGDPIDYIKRKTKFVAPVFRMIFRKADRIQAISSYLAEWANSMGGKNAVVVPNGVDIENFSKEIPSSELAAVKCELGKRDNDVFLVTASRLVVKNAVGDIISALAHLPADVKLLVLGQGYLEESLKIKVKRLKLEDRVVFKGYVSHKELPRYLKACDIFIRPSLSEGFGNSFVEAMAARIPVIATPVGGIIDFLKNKETGLFCEVENPEDIARKVQILLHDTNLRDEIVDNAFKMVKERYDWNIVAKDMKKKAFDILTL